MSDKHDLNNLTPLSEPLLIGEGLDAGGEPTAVQTFVALVWGDQQHKKYPISTCIWCCGLLLLISITWRFWRR